MIYFIGEDDKNTVKIGYTKDHHSLKKRLFSLQTGNSSKLKVLSVMEGGKKIEKKLHRMFNKKQIHLEWFLLDKELKNYINSWNKNIVDEYGNLKHDNNHSCSKNNLLKYIEML